MYEKYLLQLEEAGKIRNLKERSINCYKNYVSYFLNYMEKHPEELTCQDVRDFLLIIQPSVFSIGMYFTFCGMISLFHA